jgi:probable rRNA maturation factor
MDHGKKIEYHLKHLLLHGLLHLIGYDHMSQEEREEMENLEIEILSKWGIENPYYIDEI